MAICPLLFYSALIYSIWIYSDLFCPLISPLGNIYVMDGAGVDGGATNGYGIAHDTEYMILLYTHDDSAELNWIELNWIELSWVELIWVE
jgi:hypothetical protein